MDALRIEIQGAHDARYPLVVGDGVLFNELPAFIVEKGYRHTIIVTNAVVGPLYGEKLQRLIPNSDLVVVPDGERYKTLETLKMIYSAMLDKQATRNTLVVALGGGVMGDMGGFAAASFMRGIDFIQAPTSLLAMVDASIGGKVGVDLPEGKNLAGAFKDPIAIFQDSATLATLPKEEWRSGMAEVIKAGIIADRDLFEQLEHDPTPPILIMLERAAQVKIKIVEKDREEHGQRVLLNLGHTFGHAIELVSEFSVRHGEGVAIGLVAAARLAVKLGKGDLALATRIENTVALHGLPSQYPEGNPAALLAAMQHDKKRDRSELRFVIPLAIGSTTLIDSVPPALLNEVLEEICDA